MTTYVNHGSTVTIHSDSDISVTKNLPVGNYVVALDPGGNFLLKTTQAFEPTKRIYGDVQKRSDRVLQTFNERERSTGVLLQGSPGCGKTLLARQICLDAQKQNIPTIIINEAFTGDKFSTFIASIDQPCIIMFDEFEKVYDREDQNGVLTLFDGVFTQKKLFLVTVNDPYALIDPFLNRPGRLFYSFKYEGLSQEFIEEYINENLINKSHIQDALNLTRGAFKSISFDGLSSAVAEMNRYDESFSTVAEFLNITPSSIGGVDVSVASLKGNKIKFVRHNIDDLYSETEIGIQIKQIDGKHSDWVYLSVETDLIASDIVSGSFTFQIDSPFNHYSDPPEEDKLVFTISSSGIKKSSTLMDVF